MLFKNKTELNRVQYNINGVKSEKKKKKDTNLVAQ